MSEMRVIAYQVYPGGRTVLKEVDPEEVSVLDDIEEVERMLNDGYTVYVEQEVLERAWGDDET